MGSAARNDRLNALRFKMQSGNKNSTGGKREKISENEMPRMRGVPKGETRNKYGDTARKLNLGYCGTCGFCENPFSELPGGSH